MSLIDDSSRGDEVIGKTVVIHAARMGLAVDPHARCAQLAGATIQEGDWLSIDGDTGDVFLGQRKIVTDQPEAELAQVAHWRMGDPAVAATH